MKHLLFCTSPTYLTEKETDNKKGKAQTSWIERDNEKRLKEYFVALLCKRKIKFFYFFGQVAKIKYNTYFKKKKKLFKTNIYVLTIFKGENSPLKKDLFYI